MIVPVTLKSGRFFRPNHDDFEILLQEHFLILAQLRHMPAAVRSLEAAIEHQQYMLFALEIRQAHALPIEVLQLKIGGW